GQHPVRIPLVAQSPEGLSIPSLLRHQFLRLCRELRCAQICTSAFYRSSSALSRVEAIRNDRPLIGISASQHDFGDYGGVGVQRPVFAAGGLPVTLPQLEAMVPAALAGLDGLVLAPGRDIEPWRYGQEPHPLLGAVEPQRDEFELALVPAALELGIPILGMCRGIQVLNVA